MRARTFLALQAEAQALADCGNDPHITAADDGDGGTINLSALWVNQGIAELWRKVVRANPDRYLRRVTFSTTAGTAAYNLSDVLDDSDPETTEDDDFLAIRRLDLIRGNDRIAIDRFELQDAPYRNANPLTGGLTRYRVIGQGVDGSDSQIYFDPDPGTNTYALWYVQRPPVLTEDDDTFDGIAGLEDWVVCFAALRMCIRQETSTAEIMAEMARIESGIAPIAGQRDMGRAPKIANTRTRTTWR